MLDLEQQLADERETNALLRLKLQELESRLRVYGDTMPQAPPLAVDGRPLLSHVPPAPRDTRPLAWQDVVAIVWWTVVGLGCLKLLVDWVGWERFGFALGVLFWLVVFVVWFDSWRRSRANRKNWRPWSSLPRGRTSWWLS